ncbi:MAG: FtsX-like permease family protein [Cyclobacteriaceae bacterium]
MNLSYFIARRYFLSRKKKNFINIISIISMVVVATGTMALIVVLSVFNGLEGLLRSIYGTVDPNLVVSATVGKSFAYTDELKKNVSSVEGVEIITEVIEDNALLRYNSSERVARLKGVSDNFVEQGRLDNNIVYGDFRLKEKNTDFAILGRGVQYDLSVNPANDFNAIQVFYPQDIDPGITSPDKLFRAKKILPGAVFAIENYFDNNYVFVPLRFTETLFDYKGKRSSLEIKLKAGVQTSAAKNELQAVLGDRFLVQSSDEIHSDLYKTLKIEKFFVFLTFSIIIAIASINIFFALNMLVLDKRKDIAILLAQGATNNLIRNIFLTEGAIVAFTGALTGIILGLALCFAQQYFGFISTGTATTIMQAYPVEVQWMDVFFTVVCIIIITIMATIQPAYSATKRAAIEALQ